MSVRLISTTCWSRFGWIEIPRHQGPQQRLRVDVETGTCLVPLGDSHRDRDPDYRRDPGRRQSEPAPVPHAAQMGEQQLC
jgi:hypothetical protein